MANGQRAHGKSDVHDCTTKISVLKDMKLSDIKISMWESRAEAWHLLSDRAYRKPSKPGIKTLLQSEPRGRKSNCSLS